MSIKPSNSVETGSLPDRSPDKTLTISDASNNLVILKILSRVLNKSGGRQSLRRLVLFMCSFAFVHSSLVLSSFISSTGLNDVFESRWRVMSFALLLDDLANLIMLNHILGKESVVEALDNSLDKSQISRTYQADYVAHKITARTSGFRKKLYLLLLMEQFSHFQLIVSLILNNEGMNFVGLTFLLDLAHLVANMFASIVLIIVLNQFIIIALFVQAAFREICERAKLNKLEHDHRAAIGPGPECVSGQADVGIEMIREDRREFATTVELTRRANIHWKGFLFLFALTKFCPIVLQLHLILNKEPGGKQLLTLLFRLICNLFAVQLVLLNASPIPRLATAIYDDLYHVTLIDVGLETKNEVREIKLEPFLSMTLA